ncbi:hypothetical protein M2368_002052 [Arthrobacter sp. JUb119]|uniref:hypothetical protein n=1 Tax=Glutamicibacter sp. 2E12 TaxID=3416181 RepID=UPI002A335EC1|nr:hypothetical protein [Arthrobacter sp. JUb119]
MNRARTRLGALPMMCAAALMLAACQGAQPDSTPSQEPAPSGTSPSASASSPEASSPESSPSSSAESPDAPSTAAPELSQEHEVHSIQFMTPEQWTATGDDCEGECTEWDEWEIKDAQGKHVLTLIPTTATSPDGDVSLYERELLEREELPDPGAGTGFHPASFIAEFWESTSQEDGEKESGFDIALVDDQVLAQRNENPDLNFFKVGEQSPMMWVEEDYLEDRGVPDDPVKQQAQQFLDTQEYALVREILLSVQPAKG